MPVSKPKPNENEQDFVSRVIPELINSGKPKKQAAAIAYSTFRDAKNSVKKDAGQGIIDPEELRMGTKDEMEEHGLSISQAMKIATDHLRKNGAYYTLLKKAGL
jgi:hypothetical protein